MFKIFNLFVVCALFSIVSHASPGNYSAKFLIFTIYLHITQQYKNKMKMFLQMKRKSSMCHRENCV